MGSKFKDIFDAARNDGGEDPRAQSPRPTDDRTDGSNLEQASRRGRPAGGKKSDPAYQQVTAYVRRDLYRDVRIALLQDPDRLDFSELVDRLLEQWRQERTASKP